VLPPSPFLCPAEKDEKEQAKMAQSETFDRRLLHELEIGITEQQDAILTQIEAYCGIHGTKSWKGTIEELAQLTGRENEVPLFYDLEDDLLTMEKRLYLTIHSGEKFTPTFEIVPHRIDGEGLDARKLQGAPTSFPKEEAGTLNRQELKALALRRMVQYRGIRGDAWAFVHFLACKSDQTKGWLKARLNQAANNFDNPLLARRVYKEAVDLLG
jgi:hypothetical protein